MFDASGTVGGDVAATARRRTLFIERDLGTETTRVLVAKLARYRTLLERSAESTATVGIVVDSTPRARALVARLVGTHDALQARVWLALAPDLRSDPYGASWQSLTGVRRTTIELPSSPGQVAQHLRRLCLLEADGLEAFQPWTGEAPMLERFVQGSGR